MSIPSGGRQYTCIPSPAPTEPNPQVQFGPHPPIRRVRSAGDIPLRFRVPPGYPAGSAQRGMGAGLVAACPTRRSRVVQAVRPR